MNRLVKFDWAIKYLLRNKANFDILEGFLSELLKTDIKIEGLLESESNKNHAEDKSNRVDLLVQNEKKEHIIIEVQCSSQWDYLSRILYGTSKAIVEYLKEGQAYKNIRKVISVSIVFFNFGDGEDYLYRGTTQFKGLHKNDLLKLGPQEMEVYGHSKLPHDVFPEYYIIKVNQFDERIKDKFDEWVYFLKTEQIKPSFQAKGIQSAADKLQVLQLNEEKREAYERYQRDMHYEASMIFSHYEMGKMEGREEGREAGAKSARYKIAQSLKQRGMTTADIMENTGLSLREIEGL